MFVYRKIIIYLFVFQIIAVNIIYYKYSNATLSGNYSDSTQYFVSDLYDEALNLFDQKQNLSIISNSVLQVVITCRLFEWSLKKEWFFSIVLHRGILIDYSELILSLLNPFNQIFPHHLFW